MCMSRSRIHYNMTAPFLSADLFFSLILIFAASIYFIYIYVEMYIKGTLTFVPTYYICIILISYIPVLLSFTNSSKYLPGRIGRFIFHIMYK